MIQTYFLVTFILFLFFAHFLSFESSLTREKYENKSRLHFILLPDLRTTDLVLYTYASFVCISNITSLRTDWKRSHDPKIECYKLLEMFLLCQSSNSHDHRFINSKYVMVYPLKQFHFFYLVTMAGASAGPHLGKRREQCGASKQ